MNTKEKILKLLNKKKSVTGRDLSKFLGISRQGVNKHLKKLIQSGQIIKEGTTKGVVYRSYSAGTRTQAVKRFRKICLLSRLEEDKVFEESALLLHLNNELSRGVSNIVHYAFTEILNNAIEHSKSTKCHVKIELNQYRLNFHIRDFGIGIFHSVSSKFNLPDENAAVGELIKGKTTTMKERHSGEGVFFTSKSADIISFRSHRTDLVFDNLKQDVFVNERRFIKGTAVDFSISRRSRRRLDKIFARFAPEEFGYRFDKTRVSVKLFQEDYVSRSEARRLLSGLDKFKEIALDFRGVKSIGQGFADEIFRVFRNSHPAIILRIDNLAPPLKPVIDHVVDNRL